MKGTVKNTLVLFVLTLIAFGFASKVETVNYKCMIQLTNYTGHGAYVVVSLLDKDGNYLETLYVQGEDEEWYHDIPEWWQFYDQKKTKIDAITGATVGGGQRTIQVLKLPLDKIDAGYQLRFETAVEDQEYFKDDVQFELTSENLKTKVEGKGYIRYIRMLPTS
ncbi:MAG: DUF2271 domain-containing protein [Bacteroidota bacterium]